MSCDRPVQEAEMEKNMYTIDEVGTSGAWYQKKQIEDLENNTTQLKRIADAIEEILRIVEKDMEPRTNKKD